MLIKVWNYKYWTDSVCSFLVCLKDLSNPLVTSWLVASQNNGVKSLHPSIITFYHSVVKSWHLILLFVYLFRGGKYWNTFVISKLSHSCFDSARLWGNKNKGTHIFIHSSTTIWFFCFISLCKPQVSFKITNGLLYVNVSQLHVDIQMHTAII